MNAKCSPDLVLQNAEITTLDPKHPEASSLLVLPEWSPVKVFVGFGAPLDLVKAARAGVPLVKHSTDCHERGCTHTLLQLFAAADAANNRYQGFFGLGCDCFSF